MPRKCPACGRLKPDSAFRADSKSKKCAPCRQTARKAHIKNYFRSLTPDQRQLLTQRARAKRYGADYGEYSRSAILARWNYICAYCPASAEHLDHVHPLSRSDEMPEGVVTGDVERNIVPACARCNLSKGAKTLAEWAQTFGPHDLPF